MQSKIHPSFGFDKQYFTSQFSRKFATLYTQNKYAYILYIYNNNTHIYIYNKDYRLNEEMLRIA